LLKDFGAFEKLSRIFKKNPNMSVQDKLKAVEDMLKSVKRDLPLTQGLIHEYGMAPVGTSKDLGEVAMRELFSGLFSRGSAGSTVAGELGQMALELRQGRLNPEKQALLETLLAKKGKSLEAFKNFSPDSIFDGFRVEGFFNKEDFPALLALTSGREVVVIKRDSEGTFTPKTYSIDGTSIRESGQESVSPDQVVFFINEQNQWQVLRSVPSA
jgi:hypothetical protein